jgi:molybdenum cofactor guanylyltransferase
MRAISRNDITAVILAGGRGRRMGGQDKGLLQLNGRPLIAHVLTILRPQVGQVLINANRNQEIYRTLDHPVISDGRTGFQGPLAGLAAALKASTTPYVLMLPCDAPLLPADYAKRMVAALVDSAADITIAHDGQRLQPVHALISCALTHDLDCYLDQGERKIDHWYAQQRTTLADFSHCPEAFCNLNTPEEHRRLQRKGAAA